MPLRLLLACAVALVPLHAGAVRGRVITDDGMPLPELTRVSLRCGSAVSVEEVTSEGSFEFNQASDPSECSVSAEAPSYRTASSAVDALPEDPGIAAFVLHRLERNAGESISVSHLAAPEKGVQHFHAAMRTARRRPAEAPDEILGHLQEAVEAYPGYAQAWFEMGRLLLGRGDPEGAAAAFSKAVEADPWFVSPYRPLILLLRAAGEPAQAAAACRDLRRINPDLPRDCADE